MKHPIRVLRAFLPAAILCIGLSATAAPLIGIMATTNAVHVVKVPAYRIDWPTQTNTFHRATVTNLFAVTSATSGNATIGGTLGVTGNTTIGGTLGVTGTITGPGSGITGVLAANVPIVDAGGLLTATHVEGALAELATGLDAVDVSSYVAKAGDTMTGPLEVTYSQPELLVTSSDAFHASLILSRIYDTSYPNIYSKLLTLEGTTGDVLSEIRTTQINATQSQLSFDVHGSPGSEVVRIGPTNIVFSANLVAADISSPSGTISAPVGGFSGPGSALTSLTAANLSGDIPAASFGEVAMRWTDRDFHLEEGTTNSVGWVSYTNTSGSRRFTIDALSSAITTDQAATLRGAVMRVPRGFVAFKTTGALRVTWVSNDTGGDNEVRGITLTGWSDITSTETVLYTDTTTRDVTTAGTPEVVSINRSSFSSTTVPQWISVDVKFSLEDGDKSGVLLVEVLSE